MATGFVYHPQFREHRTGIGHPESPQRLLWILKVLDEGSTCDRVDRFEPEPIDEEWILKVHTKDHLERVRRACQKPESMLDMDTVCGPESWDAAVRAAGAIGTAGKKIQSGEWRNAFCAVRPPGHHAESTKAMGFCLFNNAAVGARYLQEELGWSRIMIVDWDVHHGNGTQEIFYRDPSVFYFSMHEFPYYPGTGAETERGEGEGVNTTCNVPLERGAGDEEYLDAMDRILAPAVADYKPDAIILSAGFDPHIDDPLAQMQVTDKGFEQMSRKVLALADEHCDGRLIVTLEGGYHLTTLGRCAVQLIDIMAGG